MYIRSIYFASCFFDFTMGFWNCFDGFNLNFIGSFFFFILLHIYIHCIYYYLLCLFFPVDSALDIITTDRTVKVSWKKLFSTHQYIFYEVSAGTVLGSADIIQWQETKNTFIEFAIPPQIKSLSGLIIYVTIRGINDNGMYYIYKDVVKLN